MTEFEFKRNELLIKTIIKNLSERNMEGFYAKDKNDALNIAKGLIKDSKTFGFGGSMSVRDIGLRDYINNNKDFISYDKHLESNANNKDIENLINKADCFIGSTNAMTEDGILINIDGIGTRVANYVFGPKKVLLIVGVNKIAKDVDSAMKRARNEAAPMNAERFEINTPCKKTGTCMNCKSPDTICCQILITRFSKIKNRIKIILVNDNLGF